MNIDIALTAITTVIIIIAAILIAAWKLLDSFDETGD